MRRKLPIFNFCLLKRLDGLDYARFSLFGIHMGGSLQKDILIPLDVEPRIFGNWLITRYFYESPDVRFIIQSGRFLQPGFLRIGFPNLSELGRCDREDSDFSNPIEILKAGVLSLFPTPNTFLFLPPCPCESSEELVDI